MGKGILIIVLGGIVILNVMNFNNNNRLTSATEVAEESYSISKAKSICNATVEMLLADLGDDGSYRDSITTPVSWFGGDVTYIISDTTIGDEDLVKIKVSAEYFNSTATSIVVAWMPSSGFSPEPIKGSINTNNDVGALGNLTIDGRDHDINGNLISNQGKYGVWTTGSYTQAAGVNIGGTDDSNIDHIPSTPGDPSIIKSNQTWNGTYPNSPDQVLGGAKFGFSEGKLKSLAQSGANGSQYVTNPASLTYPLKGITYVECASWSPADINGSGILIIHNSSLAAMIKNAQGTFKGLIIADDVDIFKGTVIGAIISLTQTPAGGVCIGNGTGNLLYSSKTINYATKYVKRLQCGFGKHRVTVKSWLE